MQETLSMSYLIIIFLYCKDWLIKDNVSQLPYIKMARDRGFHVLVMNTNNNKDLDGNPLENILTPEEHAYEVWNRWGGDLNTYANQ